jgi:DNA-binding IclR family transcriptional regulator
VGTASIAAPFFPHHGRVIAALSVAGPLSRFKPRMAECAPPLVESAARVSGRLGHGGG